jgi:hypothetical protein
VAAMIWIGLTDRGCFCMNRSTFQHQSIMMPKNFARGRKSAFHASSGMYDQFRFEGA